jgi:hypothetical protein
MRINTVSALPQMKTPGWDTPAGEELATVDTDTYKLGLLALRLLASDQDTKTAQPLPFTTTRLLSQVITDTLTNGPHSRPLPEAWIYVLRDAIEEAQQHKNRSSGCTNQRCTWSPPIPICISDQKHRCGLRPCRYLIVAEQHW